MKTGLWAGNYLHTVHPHRCDYYPSNGDNVMKRRGPKWIALAEVQAQYRRTQPRIKTLNAVQLYCVARETARYVN